MKKIFTLVIAVFAVFAALQAQTVCTVDSTNTQFGISPNDTTAPHIIRGQAFDTVAQIYVPATYSITYQGFPLTATIYWLNIDSVTNFPTGIGYQRNPNTSDTIYGGGRQCIRISGTTMDTPGVYHLNFFGHVHISVLTYDTIVSLQQLSSFSGQGAPTFGYFLTEDHGVGIQDIGQNFNSSMNVFPNPTTGRFEVTLANMGDVNGTLNVVDMTGRTVYTQKIDIAGFYQTSIDLSHFAKGLYTVQLRTANGFAAKNISVE
jgi:hypothetical protein